MLAATACIGLGALPLGTRGVTWLHSIDWYMFNSADWVLQDLKSSKRDVSERAALDLCSYVRRPAGG